MSEGAILSWILGTSLASLLVAVASLVAVTRHWHRRGRPQCEDIHDEEKR